MVERGTAESGLDRNSPLERDPEHPQGLIRLFDDPNQFDCKLQTP